MQDGCRSAEATIRGCEVLRLQTCKYGQGGWERVGEAMGRKNSWGEQEVKEWGEGVKRRANGQEDVSG